MLNEKVRKLLEKIVRSGAPPVAAALSLGIRARIIQDWLTTGMAIEKLPPPPQKPDLYMDFGRKDMEGITQGEWYEHTKQCKLLADVVCEVEGKLVGSLSRRLWVKARSSPQIQMFLYKQYGHATGLPIAQAEAPSKNTAGDGDQQPRISVVLPDNGRRKK